MFWLFLLATLRNPGIVFGCHSVAFSAGNRALPTGVEDAALVRVTLSDSAQFVQLS